jgi:hypothetical protein
MGLYPNLYTAIRVEGVYAMHLSRDLPQQVHQLVQQKAAGKGGKLQCNIFNTMSKATIRAMAIMAESTAMTIILVPKSPIHWSSCKLMSTPFYIWHF